MSQLSKETLRLVMEKLAALGPKPARGVIPEVLTRQPTPEEIRQRQKEEELANKKGPLGRGGI